MDEGKRVSQVEAAALLIALLLTESLQNQVPVRHVASCLEHLRTSASRAPRLETMSRQVELRFSSGLGLNVPALRGAVGLGVARETLGLHGGLLRPGSRWSAAVSAVGLATHERLALAEAVGRRLQAV